MPTPRSSGRGARRSVAPVALPSVGLSADLVDAALLAVPTRPDPAVTSRTKQDGAGKDAAGKDSAGKDSARAVLLGTAPVAVDLVAEKAKGSPGEVVSVPGPLRTSGSCSSAQGPARRPTCDEPALPSPAGPKTAPRSPSTCAR